VSRAEPEGAAAPPRLRRALRRAAVDFYYNAWPFLGANVALGLVLLAAFYGSVLIGPWLLLLVAVAVIPAAGTMRMATRLQRVGHTDLGDFAEVFHGRGRILLLGVAQLAIGVVLAIDIAVALAWGSWIGTILLVGAAYGIAVLWAVAVVAWPILLDPARDALPVRARLRLAFIVLLLEPRRVAGLAIAAGLVLAVSTVLIAPILTFSVAFVWLLLAGYALPLADGVEARLEPTEP
jgi:uncharacterized membrane protein YesL